MTRCPVRVADAYVSVRLSHRCDVFGRAPDERIADLPDPDIAALVVVVLLIEDDLAAIAGAISVDAARLAVDLYDEADLAQEIGGDVVQPSPDFDDGVRHGRRDAVHAWGKRRKVSRSGGRATGNLAVWIGSHEGHLISNSATDA
jgi:hypothetical protein